MKIKCVGDKFEMLSADLIIFVGKIPLVSTRVSSIDMATSLVTDVEDEVLAIILRCL